VREWRLEVPESLRTTFPLTEECQEEFYRNVVCDRKSEHRYFALCADSQFAGMGGITGIQWENRLGEISLILDPARRHEGLGMASVRAILACAFQQLNLQTVFGECYECNEEGMEFWIKVAKHCNGYAAHLPGRKFWNGKYYDSIYFAIDKDMYESALQ
jgi:RimJ/RimL family protein N-acetyltransferase